jgi:methyltransferase (TIGR00027 family)
VAIDLRHDWPAALRAAGLDATARTAWSAEGLLPFLPPDAADRLLDNITELSPAGSRLATENMPNAAQAMPKMAERMAARADRWRQHGLDIDMTDLWYSGERNDVVDYLNTHGWAAGATKATDLLAAHGFSVPTGDEDAWMFAPLGYVTATRT